MEKVNLNEIYILKKKKKGIGRLKGSRKKTK